MQTGTVGCHFTQGGPGFDARLLLLCVEFACSSRVVQLPPWDPVTAVTGFSSAATLYWMKGRKENACKMTFCLSRPGICGLLLPVTSSSDGHDVSKKLFWHFTSAV